MSELVTFVVDGFKQSFPLVVPKMPRVRLSITNISRLEQTIMDTSDFEVSCSTIL